MSKIRIKQIALDQNWIADGTAQYQIKNIADPTLAQDVATKAYVDAVNAADTFVTGATVSYLNEAGTATFTNNDGDTFTLTGISDVQTTGASISYINEAGTITFTQNDGSTFTLAGISDVQTTGGTYDNATGDITFTQNDGSTFAVDLSAMDLNDTFTTGATLIGNVAYFDNQDGLSAYTLDLSGLVTASNGLTEVGNDIQLGGALTQDTVISGASRTLDLGVSASQLSFLRINAIQASEEYSVPGQGLTIQKNPGGINASIDATSVNGTSSSFNLNPGNVELKSFHDSGTTSSGILLGQANSQIFVQSGGTFSGLILNQSTDSFVFVDGRATTKGLEYAADYSSGWTNNSLITKKYVDDEIAALDAADTFVTGGTISYVNEAGTATFTNNDGATFNVTGISDVQTTGASISYINEAGTATFTQNDGTTFTLAGISDVQTTGGTYDNATGDITFTQNDGSTFAVDLSAMDLNDTFVTGGTISYVNEAGTATFTNNDGATFNVTGISDVQTTGGSISYVNEAGTITFTQNDGSTFDIAGISDVQTTGASISYVNEAGTITFTQNDGSTFSLAGITDVQTTGGTYDNATGDITFTQNDGSTFVVDLSSSDLNDTFTTGSTLVGSTLVFDTTDASSAYSVDLSALYTGANGVTITTGDTVELGGTLSSSTVIDGNGQTFDLGTSGSQLSFFRVNAVQASEDYSVPGQGLTIQKNPGGINASMDATSVNGTSSSFNLNPGNVELKSFHDSGATASNLFLGNGVAQLTVKLSGSTQSGIILSQPTDEFIFLDTRATTKGLEYYADYSSGYTDNSLIVKRDLDNAISALTKSVVTEYNGTSLNNITGGTGTLASDPFGTDTLDADMTPQVYINGVKYVVGDGSTVGADAWFADSLTPGTAKAFNALSNGDVLIWSVANSSIEIDTADKVSVVYTKVV